MGDVHDGQHTDAVVGRAGLGAVAAVVADLHGDLVGARQRDVAIRPVVVVAAVVEPLLRAQHLHLLRVVLLGERVN